MKMFSPNWFFFSFYFFDKNFTADYLAGLEGETRKMLDCNLG